MIQAVSKTDFDGFCRKTDKLADQIRLKYLKGYGFRLSEEEEKYFSAMMANNKLTGSDLKGIIRIAICLKAQHTDLKCFDSGLFDRFLDTMVSNGYKRTE